MTEPNRIPNYIVQEAEDLAKETGINFRSILEVLYMAYLQLNTEFEPVAVVSRQ